MCYQDGDGYLCEYSSAHGKVVRDSYHDPQTNKIKRGLFIYTRKNTRTLQREYGTQSLLNGLKFGDDLIYNGQYYLL